MPQQPAYKRVLLKISGEALMGRRDYGLDNETIAAIEALSASPEGETGSGREREPS